MESLLSSQERQTMLFSDEVLRDSQESDWSFQNINPCAKPAVRNARNCKRWLTGTFAKTNSGWWCSPKGPKKGPVVLKEVFISIEKLNIFIKKLKISIEKVIFFIKKLNISIEKLIISIEKANISIEKLNISIEKTNISIERLVFFIEKTDIFTRKERNRGRSATELRTKIVGLSYSGS